MPARYAFLDPTADGSFGFATAAPSVAASQRASLGRGLALVLLLAASSLASVYLPLAMHGADWVEDSAPGPLVANR